MLSNISCKDIEICFGRFPKTREIIAWNFVESSDDGCDRLSYLAKEGVAVVPFQYLAKGMNANKLSNCYYQNSDLQRWINGEFLELYFVPEEREKIKKVSIPTIDEIGKWLPQNADRICVPSNEARVNGAAVFSSYNDMETCAYWLADTGRKAGMSATVVMADGSIYKSAYLAATNVCVRPIIEFFREER